MQVRFISRDVLEYLDGKTNEYVQTRSMRGLLLQHVIAANSTQESSPELAMRLFQNVQDASDNIFEWSKRGVNLFRTMTNSVAPKQLTTGAEDNAWFVPDYHSRFFQPIGVAEGELPDLIILTEYDVHAGGHGLEPLQFLPERSPEHFDSAMRAVGYHTILAEGVKNDGGGIGIFAKKAVFDLLDINNQPIRCDAPIDVVLRVSGEQTVKDSNGAPMQGVELRAESTDLKETWHRRRSIENNEPLDVSNAEIEMSKQDRKVVALVALAFAQGLPAAGQRIVVLGSHLMTTSRDTDAMTHFPGYTRAREIASVRERVREFVRREEAVVWGGDFNINMRGYSELSVLRGRIQGLSQKIDTGFFGGKKFDSDDDDDDEGGEGKSDGHDKAVNQTHGHSKDKGVLSEIGCFSHFFRSFLGPSLSHRHKLFRWQRCDGDPLIMADAFEGHNHLTEYEDGSRVGTSHNASRLDTIDYIWYDKTRLEVVSTSPLHAPDPAPNAHNPSDHIPILARLRVIPHGQ
eukprot:c11973_g1_i1.p1 GENE.c11973_g1_i1~~c11973_g1_i1.p1  ORF type:complete len:516 (+),score=115.87 c11973_g1_i1:476-2023(+)